VELEYTDEFNDNLKAFDDKTRNIIRNKLRLLVNDYRHPSLHASKWREPNEWYCRMTLSIRLFYEVHDGFYRLMAIGPHDIERTR